jgi:hypothetical protein
MCWLVDKQMMWQCDDVQYANGSCIAAKAQRNAKSPQGWHFTSAPALRGNEGLWCSLVETMKHIPFVYRRSRIETCVSNKKMENRMILHFQSCI